MSNLLFPKISDTIDSHNQRLIDITDRLNVIEISLTSIEDALDDLESRHAFDEIEEDIKEIVEQMADREGVEPPTY